MSAKLPTAEHLRDKTKYGLYCVNIFGTGLNSIKDEFKRQVRTGLRQTVYILDLDELEPDMRKELKDSSTHLMNSIHQQIQEFGRDYEIQTRKINEGLKFDLYDYWLNQNGDVKKRIVEKTDNMKEKVKAKSSDTKPDKGSKKDDIACPSSLIVKKHNRVGQPKIMDTGKFRKDEPILGKLYIIILGQMSKSFYTDLLRRNQPLEGIINFIPAESNYDIMLGNNKIRNFIATTLENINSSIYKLRQEITMKPVGLFTHELPVISSCLATKHSRDIFDQLTWSIYDIDILRQQYETYYFKPFQVMNVEMPTSVNLTQLYHEATSLRIQGNFQKSLLPASDGDLASITGYLNSLLTACALQDDFMQESQQIRSESENKFQNACSPVTNISTYKKLVVAENNKLLLNMLQYTDLDKFLSIYLCCSDYNIFRQYVVQPPQEPLLISINDKSEYLSTAYSLILPQYVKYYADADCCSQRISELLNEHDEYKIQKFAPGYKLHTFKRNYNVLKESEGRVIIPTRLCFRDFTLFEMEELLQNLKSADLGTNSFSDSCTKTAEFDENIFIRPNSLKAPIAQSERKSEEHERKKRKSDSKGKSEKKSSLSQAIFKTEESLLLSPDNYVLKGYNFEDTLQEIKYKTFKYYYHHGFVKLYEEKWCFQDMNKQLSLSINNATLFFSRPRHQLEGISNNIRLITQNNISIRILNDLEECSKIVMNYPNGLSVLHRENNCEQFWYCEQTPQDEQRRIYTNCGAIIIFFKSSDLIMILRYNGEVYRLYQHELAEEGEEEGVTSNLGDIEEKTSEFEELRTQGDSLQAKGQNDDSKKQRIATRKSSKLSSTVVDAKKSRSSQKCSSAESIQSSAPIRSAGYNLKSLVKYELKFLSSLCSIYNLTYLHLIITTSQGQSINLTHQGEIYEGRQCSIHEWHDYFANEAYCERSDGVKMIWTQKDFKCFYKDGSVFTTTIEEDVTEANVDEFESRISASSSHNQSLEAMEDNKISENKEELDGYSTQKPTLEYLISTFNYSAYTTTETGEDYTPEDIQILSYKCKSWSMQHPNYAEVYALTSKHAHVEIFGIDNIRIYTHVEEDVEEYDSLGAGSESVTETKSDIKLLAHVWIGEKLHVTADIEGCEVYAVVPQSKLERELKSDSLTLNIKYTDCIRGAFEYMVKKIASLRNCSGQNVEELFFVEKMNTDSSIRGFEFFSSLPVNPKYTYRVSNNITELKAVNTISGSMIHNCEGHTRDLGKFPRFKQKQQGKTCYSAEIEFPPLLSANIFIEIPKQLLNLTNVTKFLEPFESIHFKSLRAKFKNVLNYYLKPQQQCYLKILSSSRNWRKRLWEHERRLFTEKQRLGLYRAMNIHKIYPNYWLFTQTYGNKLRHIDFFDFMQKQCETMQCGNNEVNK